LDDFKEQIGSDTFLTYAEVDVPQEDITMNYTMNTTMFREKYLNGDGKLEETVNNTPAL